MIVNSQTSPKNISLTNASEIEAPSAGNHENAQLHAGEYTYSDLSFALIYVAFCLLVYDRLCDVI